MIQRLWLPRVAACAALLAGLCISGDDVWRVAAQQGVSPDALAAQRAMYDDPVVFEQLSAGARMRLERLFGRKDRAKGADTPAPEGDRLPDAPALDSPALLANTLVNNTALDTTQSDTQSGTDRTRLGVAGSWRSTTVASLRPGLISPVGRPRRTAARRGRIEAACR